MKTRLGILGALFGILLIPSSSPGEWIWDDNISLSGAQDGGGNCWSVDGNNWWDGYTNDEWSNGAVATFGATSGNSSYTVNLGSSIVTSGVVFANQNYTLGVSPDFPTATLTMSSGSIVALSDATIQVSTVLNASTPFNSATGKTLTVSGPISGLDGLMKTGNGVLTLSGANTYQGGTTVSSGTLNLNYLVNNSSKLKDTERLTLQNATLQLIGGSHTETVNATTIAAGAFSVTRLSGSSVLQMKDITRSLGSTIDFASAAIATTSSSNVNGILGGYATVAGTDWATSNSGPITAFTGYIDIGLGGVIGDSFANNVRILNSGSGSISLAAATTTINSLLQNSTSNTFIDTASNTLCLGRIGGILLPNGKGSLTIGLSANSGFLTARATGTSSTRAGDLIFINNSPSNAITVNATITNYSSSGSTYPVSLTKSGIGALTINGANTFSGSVFLNQGVLNLNNAAALGSVTANKLNIYGGTLQNTSGNALTLNDYPQDWNADFAFNGADSITYGSGDLNLGTGIVTIKGNCVVTTTNGNLTIGGVICGTGYSLTKSGSGKLTFLGTNNLYTGGTILNDGTLSFAAGTFPAIGWLTMNGGALEWNNLSGSNDIDLSMRMMMVDGKTATFAISEPENVVTFHYDVGMNTTAALKKTGPGTLVIAAAMLYSGKTTIEEGTLVIENGRTTTLGEIDGDYGNLTIVDTAEGATTTLNATSIRVNTLTIGSPWKASAAPSLPSITSIPEPSTFVLLIVAGLASLGFFLKRKG